MPQRHHVHPKWPVPVLNFLCPFSDAFAYCTKNAGCWHHDKDTAGSSHRSGGLRPRKADRSLLENLPNISRNTFPPEDSLALGTRTSGMQINP